MENRYSVLVKIISAIQAAIIFLLGVLYFIFGCYMVFGDALSMSSGLGGNLSGIMIIFGLPIVILGFIFFYGAKSALLVFSLNAKGLKPTIYVSILAAFSLMVYKGSFYSNFLRKGIFSLPLGEIIIWNIIIIFFLVYLMMTKQLIDKDAQSFSPKQKKAFIIFLICITCVSLVLAIGKIAKIKQTPRFKRTYTTRGHSRSQQRGPSKEVLGSDLHFRN